MLDVQHRRTCKRVAPEHDLRDLRGLIHKDGRRTALVGAFSKALCRRKSQWPGFSRSGQLVCQRDSLGGSCLALPQNVQSRSFPGASPLPISSAEGPAASKPFCSGSGGAFEPDMHGRQLNLRRGRRSGPVGWRPRSAIGQVKLRL